jgi:hypothetical protein
MENNIDILHSRTGCILVAHIGFYELESVYDTGEIALFACQPSETSLLQMLEPMKPAPPVTKKLSIR